jgi:hypothetical protein
MEKDFLLGECLAILTVIAKSFPFFLGECQFKTEKIDANHGLFGRGQVKKKMLDSFFFIK